MNSLWLRLLLPLLVVATLRGEEPKFDPEQYMREKSVVILACEKSFASTQREAKRLSQATGATFSLREMVWDQKRGLILPDDHPDGAWAGSYVARRNSAPPDTECDFLSIERSDAYTGFARGYYMVVAGIYDDPKEAQTVVARLKRFAQSAYAKRTKIYMGCMH